MTTPHPMSSLPEVDPSDIPTVTVRELVLAVKLLGARGGTLTAPEALDDGALRTLEQDFWHFFPRDRIRKTAVLLRLRCLVEVCRARRVAALMADGGQEAVLQIISAASRMRLNSRWGFNPQKLALAVRGSLPGPEIALMQAA